MSKTPSLNDFENVLTAASYDSHAGDEIDFTLAELTESRARLSRAGLDPDDLEQVSESYTDALFDRLG